MLAFIASWFTPAYLFIVLNLVIGTIVVSSRFHSSSSDKASPAHHHFGHSDPPLPLARAPSLIDRVRSINFSGLYSFDRRPVPDYNFSEQRPADQFTSSRFEPPPAQIARAPSLIQRVKSINFASYIYDHPTPAAILESEYAPPAEPVPLARAPSLLELLKSINFSPYRNNHPDPVPERNTAQVYSEPARARPTRAEPPPVAPVPSFLERVKSINFSLYGKDEPEPAILEDHYDNNVNRVNSDTKPAGGEVPPKLSRKMKKSASDKSSFNHFKSEDGEEQEDVTEPRRPQTKKGPGVVAVEEAEEIDSKADDFINRFKQQLKLQRLESLVRYKEMLSRGSAHNAI